MNFEHNLETLIRSKRFEELNSAERRLIQEHLSETEYRQFRIVLCGVQNRLNLQQTKPAPRVKNNLMAALRKKRKARRPVATFLTKVADYQIHAWQAAAMFAGLLFIAFWGQNQLSQNISSVVSNENTPKVVLVDTVFETKYDTVYKEKPATRLVGKKVNVSPEKVYGKVVKEDRSTSDLSLKISTKRSSNTILQGMLPEAPLLADTTLPRRLRELETKENSLWNEKSVGRTVNEDRELMQFFGEVN